MALELQWHDYAGLLGVGLVLLAFFGLQAGRLRGEGIVYQLMNLLGATLVLISLFYSFNLSAFVIQIAWIAISLYGIARGIRLRRARRE
ncbi:MAG: CBU_0592 family membrane protein [Rehaibacterium terrae]|uniref:CBU_0592 family membrane protein n=1 Tax=Rehaibacterium terrae TaxID=1341696 RepID=UPI003919979E